MTHQNDLRKLKNVNTQKDQELHSLPILWRSVNPYHTQSRDRNRGHDCSIIWQAQNTHLNNKKTLKKTRAYESPLCLRYPKHAFAYANAYPTQSAPNIPIVPNEPSKCALRWPRIWWRDLALFKNHKNIIIYEKQKNIYLKKLKKCPIYQWVPQKTCLKFILYIF